MNEDANKLDLRGKKSNNIELVRGDFDGDDKEYMRRNQ